MKSVVLLLGFLLGSITWVLSIVSWFHHDDHAALGWFMLCMLISAWIMGQALGWYIRENHRA